MSLSSKRSGHITSHQSRKAHCSTMSQFDAIDKVSRLWMTTVIPSPRYGSKNLWRICRRSLVSGMIPPCYFCGGEVLRATFPKTVSTHQQVCRRCAASHTVHLHCRITILGLAKDLAMAEHLHMSIKSKLIHYAPSDELGIDSCARLHKLENQP